MIRNRVKGCLGVNMKKAFVLAIVAVSLLVGIAFSFTACGKKTSKLDVDNYGVFYTATYGGYIDGTAEQIVEHGANATTVTAVAYEGYKFTGWSDDKTEPTRTDNNVKGSIGVTAHFERSFYDIEYTVSIGGYIDGDASQKIEWGEDASKVTAVPNVGYIFSMWSDNKTTPDRTDIDIKSNLNVTAIFEEITQMTFTYIYNGAKEENTVKTLELKLEDLAQISLATPERDGFIFEGWYLDWLFEKRVSDEFGHILIGKEIFAAGSTQLFAKWRAVDIVTYEVLMVFVTELSATLEANNDANIIDVYYKMTDTEKRVCELVAVMFEQYLDALLNGLVDFEIDTYFTTEILGKQNLYRGSTTPSGGTNLVYDYGLDAYNIPELGGVSWQDGSGLPPLSEIEQNGILGDYRSVITTFNMSDYDNLLHITAGSGGAKYASIHMESLFGVTKQGYDVEHLLDFENESVHQWWEFFMELYLHEFTHTIEQIPEILGLNKIDYHDVLKYYSDTVGAIGGHIGMGDDRISEIEVIRLFLLNQAVVNGNNVGIPPDFWEDESAYPLYSE